MFLYLYRQSVEMVDFSNLVSSVVTKTEMRVVWAWIPERFALFSPIRLFNAEEHGRSLYSYVTFLHSFLIPLGKCLLVWSDSEITVAARASMKEMFLSLYL